MPTNEIPPIGSASDARSLCWSCREEPGAGPFCAHCVRIQPITALGDYFALFGLEKSYMLDPAKLKNTFYELSRKFHPDYYSGHLPEEQRLARDNTAYLNNALNTLSDPLKRAEYLLSLLSGSYSGSPSPPQELFEEILEVGDLLETDSLSQSQRNLLESARDNFRVRQQELFDSLAPLFIELKTGSTIARVGIESRLNNIKYLRTILARIDQALGKEGDPL
jgi:molecular chaperone HscB